LRTGSLNLQNIVAGFERTSHDVVEDNDLDEALHLEKCTDVQRVQTKLGQFRDKLASETLALYLIERSVGMWVWCACTESKFLIQRADSMEEKE
jgi:hypothetical protein